MEILIGVASFLGGALLTSLWYTFALYGSLKDTIARLDAHLRAPAPSCPLHESVHTDLARIKDKVKLKDASIVD